MGTREADLLAERMVANLLDNAVCHNVADGRCG
jgi:hypothetical protein